MTFRLNKFQIEDDDFHTSEIQLVDPKRDKTENYFSLIVGNNGAGKSRLLGSIAKALTGKFKSNRSNLFFFSNFETTSEPSKTIALSNSLSDKFPMDGSFNLRSQSVYNYREERYNYLGTRGRMGASARQLMRKAVDILLENYSNKNISKSYRHVFDYLDYKPIIKLEYRIIQRELNNSSDEIILPKHILEYIERRTSYSGFRKSTFETFEERYGDKIPEICNFLNELRDQEKRTYELVIDFSSSNIRRIGENNELYEEDIRIYEILNILRKLNMIRGFEVKVYKKGKEEFNFGEASSGEANILTTMISLIPLVEDNCCVLIDEPEISLHPSWQYRYIELLTNVFQSFKGCHIIIASHSHFLVSDLPIDNSSVITLNKIDGLVRSTLLPNSTFGWSAEDILLNIFNMPTTRNYYISTIVSEALELLSDNNKSTDRFIEIKNELKIIEPKLKK
jgi:predicted ATPase